jgi:Type II secretory pathway, component PulD
MSQETLVMSGLVQRLTQTIINRVPLLSKIPILGELSPAAASNKARRNWRFWSRPFWWSRQSNEGA